MATGNLYKLILYKNITIKKYSNYITVLDVIEEYVHNITIFIFYNLDSKQLFDDIHRTEISAIYLLNNNRKKIGI